MNRSAAVHLNAAEVAAGEREEFIREALVNSVTATDIEHLVGDSQAIDMRLDAAALGPLAVQSMWVSAVAARRTARLARDESPASIFAIFERAGSSKVIQEGRQTVVGPGELVLVSTTRPSLVVSDQYSHRDNLQIPVELLALPEAVLRQALAVTLGPELAIAAVLGRFIDSLTGVPDVPPAEAEHLARAGVDLVRGLVATVLSDSRPASDSLDATLTLRVTDYLHTHWREHDLTADRVAAAHHVSTRQLYRLLAAQGISLGDWLRERRLEAARDELARTGMARVTVAGIGRRWGFSDPTNFRRAFKSSYGLTPLEWRRLHQTLQA